MPQYHYTYIFIIILSTYLAYFNLLFSLNQVDSFSNFSIKGNEVAFGTIGDGATAEGLFFEAINAAGVMQIPMIVSVWDDGFGISVPKKYATTKADISKAMAGFRREEGENGIDIYNCKGWNYKELCDAYKAAVTNARTEHVPSLIHVDELTQPQGHSSSGSHERYKTKERLQWEEEYDSILQMKKWILDNSYASEAELEAIEEECKNEVKEARNKAWKAYKEFLKPDHEKTSFYLEKAIEALPLKSEEFKSIKSDFEATPFPVLSDDLKAMKKLMRVAGKNEFVLGNQVKSFIQELNAKGQERYSTHLHSESPFSALKVDVIPVEYSNESQLVDGREVVRACFDAALERDPRVFAFGEDVGDIGDVNQGFAGLQRKHGTLRVSDTGIRESTIIGQGIGAAIRGLRPIAEVQYLDYLIYTIQTLSDDLACLHYRTKGGQKSPLLLRTRGHRLEGVWHSGSPMSMILGTVRGIYLLVPRDMTQAAGMYNTMLKSDDTAIIIECLNGYRLKEKMPSNIGEYTVPIGIPETIHQGDDVTIVTYGSMCRVVMEAVALLEEKGISCEVVDVQTLMPFDIHHKIVESIKKTNRVVFADEDVPGGASAYMMQEVLENQNAYKWLDSKPVTIAAKPHRPAYATDGDYFSKPNADNVFDTICEMMNEVDPVKYPLLY